MTEGVVSQGDTGEPIGLVGDALEVGERLRWLALAQRELAETEAREHVLRAELQGPLAGLARRRELPIRRQQLAQDSPGEGRERIELRRLLRGRDGLRQAAQVAEQVA